MRTALPLLLFALLGSVALATDPSVDPTPDELLLTNGDSLEGKLLRVETDRHRVRFEMRIGAGRAETALPLNLVEKILLGRPFDPAPLSALAPSARLAVLEPLWEHSRELLALPETDAGAIGLSLAATLVELGRFSEALGLLEQLSNDWSPQRKVEGMPWMIRAWLGLKDFDKALQITTELERLQGDPAKVAFVQLALGEVCFAQQQWNAALDHFLYHRLHNPTLSAEVSQGLLGAARVCRRQGRDDEAARFLRDLLQDYPDCSLRPTAERELRELLSTPKPNPPSTPSSL
jgi:tetratricopeptide (TPR) repeat protein